MTLVRLPTQPRVVYPLVSAPQKRYDIIMESTALMTKCYTLLTASEREITEVYDNRLDCLVHRTDDLVVVENIGFAGAQWFEAERLSEDCFEVTFKVTEREPVRICVPEWWVQNWIRESQEKHQASHVVKGTFI